LSCPFPLVRNSARAMLVLTLGASALLAGCLNDKKGAAADASQVAVTINGDEVSIHQVRALLTTQPGLANRGADAGQVALNILVDQELAAQAARKGGLDKRPEVIQLIELAKRDVLAKAYQESVQANLTQPDTETVDRYYDEHPELFGHRKRYTLTETTLRGAPEALKPVLDKVEQAPTTEAIKSLVSTLGLPVDSRNFTLWAEELPLSILPRLVYLKDGQSVGVMQAQGLVIVTVQHAEERPMSRSLADGPIRAALLADARRKAMDEAMASLRQQAKMSYNPPFTAPSQVAPAASGASAAH
jgi:EpsD family peptidyl-prolyl cis-trans isomerase